MEEAKSLSGIVLQSYAVKDSSRVVDLFTLEEGRLSFMARGAKRDKSRFLNLSEPFVSGSYHLIAGRTMHYIKEGEIQNAHLGLRHSIRRMTAARFATEALLGILVDGPEPDYFYLYAAFLDALEEAPDARISFGVFAYLIKLMSFAGFRPMLGRCPICGQVPTGDVLFDAEAGGVICAAHGAAPTGTLLRAGEYALFVHAIRRRLRDILHEVDLCGADGKRLARLGFQYYGTHTGKRTLPSLAMMKRLALL